jgi:hypothetical protein
VGAEAVVVEVVVAELCI